MQANVILDDELIASAEDLTGLTETSSLISEALNALIEREASRRLAALGGTVPGLAAPPRRQFRTDDVEG
jgi:Arc/MetJ family transcription regulator